MSYLVTIAWLHKTFTTRQRTADLLRPELDEHIISLHDYELATRFLPGPSMNWHVAYGAGTSAAVYGYGSHLAQPRWNSWRLRLASFTAFLAGSTYGTFRQILVHYRFAKSLENPQGFIIALNHVDERLGGSGHIGLAFKEILGKKAEIKSNFDHTSHARDMNTDMVPEEGWVRDQDDIDGDTSRSNSTQFRTRWDEIRTANLRDTDHSSWDTIRQRHERNRLTDSSRSSSKSSPITEAGRSGVGERADVQAESNALLLEAERRRGHSHGDRE